MTRTLLSIADGESAGKRVPANWELVCRDGPGASLRVLAQHVATAAALACAGALLAGPARAADRFAEFAEFGGGPLIALTHVELWDGTGAAPRPDTTLLIRDGRIAAIGPSAELKPPAEAKVVDMTGQSLSPGYVMVHEHLFYPLNRGSYGAMFNTFPALYLAGGATTIRTAGSMSPYADLNLARDIAAGTTLGPDMDVTAPYFNGKEPFVMQVPRVGSDAQARTMAAYWEGEGATSYKAYMTLKRAQLRVLIEEAHKRGRKVTAHLCGVSYRQATELGIDNLEHGFFVASDFVDGRAEDECPSGERVLASLNALPADSPRMAELQRRMIEKKVALTSTLTVFETFASGRPMAPQGALDLLTADLRVNYLSRWSALNQLKSNAWSQLLPKAMGWEKRFFDSGGLLLAGTDPTGYGGVVPGFSNVRQIELLEEAGLTRAQALQVSTLNGATYLGRQAEVGSVAVGKRADLVAYKSLLSQDPQGLRGIVWTMKSGQAWNRAKLLAANRGKVGLE